MASLDSVYIDLDIHISEETKKWLNLLPTGSPTMSGRIVTYRSKFVNELIKQLGLDDKMVKSINLKIEQGQAVMLEVVRYISQDELEAVVTSLSRYEIREPAPKPDPEAEKAARLNAALSASMSGDNGYKEQFKLTAPQHKMSLDD